MLRRSALSVSLLTVWFCLPVAAQWSEPVRVSRNMVWSYSLAMDPADAAHGVWSLYPPDNWLEYAYKPPTSDTWTSPRRVTHDNPSMREGIVLCGPADTTYVLWIGEYGGGIWLTRNSADTWTTPEPFPGWTRAGSGLRGSCDQQGRIHIVWQGLGTFDTIWYARYQDGVWTGPDVVATHDSVFHYRVLWPDVTTDREGNAIVVCVRTYDTLGPPIVRQTGDSWSAPSSPRGTGRDEWDPRTAVDSSGEPRVAWHDGWRSFFSEQLPDSWSLTERLDSAGRGAAAGPSLCVDRWNRLHVLYVDSGASGWGVRERIRADGQWSAISIADSFAGSGELAVGRDRVYALIRRTSGMPYEGEVVGTGRRLYPPGVEEEPVVAVLESPEVISPLTPSSTMSFALVKPERVHVDIIDSAGQCIGRISLGLLKAGRHDFRPFDHVPARGVAFLRVVAAGTNTIVKVVRIN